MKDLFEYIFDPIVEGILDADDIGKAVDTALTDSWVKENIKGDYKAMKLKNGTYKCWGTMILKNYKGEDFGGLIISSLQGSLYVENCPNIKSLDGLFEKWGFGENEIKAKVTGDISITKCDSFESLKGIPMHIDGKFSVIDCRSFRDLNYAPDMVTDIVLIKNGKKWKENQVKKAFACAMRITCSEEEATERLLCEAMSESHLIEFWDWVRDKYQKSDKKHKLNLTRFFDYIQLDQVRPSDVTVYDTGKDKIIDVRSAVSKTLKNRGVVITKRDGEYEYIMGDGDDMIALNRLLASEEDRHWGDDGKYYRVGANNILDYIGKKNPSTYSPNKVREVICIAPSGDSVNRYKIRGERSNARSGMVENTPEYYKKVSEANRKRWREIIAKNKSEREYAKYTNIVAFADKCIARYAKLVTKIADPIWLCEYKRALEEVNKLVAAIVSRCAAMMEYANYASGKKRDIVWSKDENLAKADKAAAELRDYITKLDTKLNNLGV